MKRILAIFIPAVTFSLSMMLLNPDSDIRAQPRYQGCTLSAEAGREQMTGLFTSSGNTRLDQAFNQEYAWLTGVFGVRPSLFMYEDSDGPNAKAMPVSYKPGQFQGTVIFGINLLHSEFERNPVNFTIPAILAHEFGHIIQFTGRIQLTGKLIELHADYIAGWYMKHRDTAWSEISIRQSMDGFYRIGDYDFNSPLHHGTPDERLNAFLGGVRDSSSNVAAMVRNGSQFVTQNFGGGGTIGPSTGGSARSTRTETDEDILSAIRRIVRESSSNFRGIRGERGILDNEWYASISIPGFNRGTITKGDDGDYSIDFNSTKGGDDQRLFEKVSAAFKQLDPSCEMGPDGERVSCEKINIRLVLSSREGRRTGRISLSINNR